ASGQVAHLDLTKEWRADTVRDALNAHLKPDPIAVIACERVSDAFDARFSARRRHYLYRLIDRRAPLVLERNRAWQVPVALDAEAMHAAGQALVGHHDFTTFRSVQCQAKSPVKTIDGVTVDRAGEIIEVRVWARSFMHSQVRSMVGTLKEVGAGKWTARDVEQALAACDRSRCGPVAPAHGLYLTRVEYPDLDPCT
ncbi:MAG: tRNA pseudouridine synthase A, partial [Pseudomonadota bacterium]